MGWYKTIIAKYSSTYESKIVKMAAEKIIRRRLFYKGNSSPSPEYVQTLVSNVVDTLVKKHGSLDKLRRASNSENLSTLIEKAVEESLP